MSDAAVAAVARLLARDRLVEAFGHVSARSGDGCLITPTSPPLEAVCAQHVLELDAAGNVVRGDAAARPLEAPLHLAIYAVRADVHGICRTHSPAAAAAAAGGRVPPAAHGLGLLAGEVAVHAESDLVTTSAMAAAAAADLGTADCLLLRANGAVCTGVSLQEAVVRAHYLEERCAIAARSGGAALSETERLARGRHVEPELTRAWRWLALRHGDHDLPQHLDPAPQSTNVVTDAPDRARVGAPHEPLPERRHG